MTVLYSTVISTDSNLSLLRGKPYYFLLLYYIGSHFAALKKHKLRELFKRKLYFEDLLRIRRVIFGN